MNSKLLDKFVGMRNDLGKKSCQTIFHLFLIVNNELPK